MRPWSRASPRSAPTVHGASTTARLVLMVLVVAMAGRVLSNEDELLLGGLGTPGSEGFADRYRRALEAESEYPPFVAPAVAPRASRFSRTEARRVAERASDPAFLQTEAQTGTQSARTNSQSDGAASGRMDSAAEKQKADLEKQAAENDAATKERDANDPRKNRAGGGPEGEFMDARAVETEYNNVFCRCAPLACNCTKKCSCYMNPDGTRAKMDPTIGIAKQFADDGSSKASAAKKRASSSASFQNFFQPFTSFMEQAGEGRAGAGDTCPATDLAATARLRGARPRARGAREEWCVKGGRTHRELEANVAAAADQKTMSMLELNASWINTEDLYHFGGDPDFVRQHTEQYLCDKKGCDEMKCKCKKYCRCRGVPIPMFEGEDDANSKGIPVTFNKAGYWPWWPKLYTTYDYNTEPPRN